MLLEIWGKNNNNFAGSNILWKTDENYVVKEKVDENYIGAPNIRDNILCSFKHVFS